MELFYLISNFYFGNGGSEGWILDSVLVWGIFEPVLELGFLLFVNGPLSLS